jgi:cell wall-associated NlpC family hydrolase
MATKAGISGRALALATGGAVLVYAGLRGESPLEALRGILTGSPPPVPTGKPVTIGEFSSGTIGDGEGGFIGSGAFPSLAQAATKYLGRPYKWAGTFSGGSGGDCSGLVVRAFADIGITGVPRTSWGQRAWSKVKQVGAAEASAGDLVWWPGHIGIMVSNKRMINSPHTGAVVGYASVGPRKGQAPTFLRYGGARPTGPKRSGRAI